MYTITVTNRHAAYVRRIEVYGNKTEARRLRKKIKKDHPHHSVMGNY